MRLALSAVTRSIAQRRVLVASSLTTRSSSPLATTTTTTRGVTTHSQLSSEHSMVYEMCRKFADEELTPNAGKWDKDHSFPTEAVNKLVRVESLCSVTLHSRVNCFFAYRETTRVGVGKGGGEDDDFKASTLFTFEVCQGAARKKRVFVFIVICINTYSSIHHLIFSLAFLVCTNNRVYVQQILRTARRQKKYQL